MLVIGSSEKKKGIYDYFFHNSEHYLTHFYFIYLRKMGFKDREYLGYIVL